MNNQVQKSGQTKIEKERNFRHRKNNCEKVLAIVLRSEDFIIYYEY